MAIVGSSGAMGSFFARYFLSRGEDVLGVDVKRGRRGSVVNEVSDIRVVKDADAVIVATPMATTAAVCRRASGYMREGSLLVEISSVKGKVPAELGRMAEKSGLKPLSVHPLFGPDLRGYVGMRIAVIKEGNDDSMRDARRLFPEARLIPMSADAHDTLMAVMLSLTHLMNIAYAAVVSEVISPRVFRRIATPSSMVQLALAEGVLSQDASLLSGIQVANGHVTGVIKRMALELLSLNELIARGDEKRLRSDFKRLARAFSADGSSMRNVYRAYEAISD